MSLTLIATRKTPSYPAGTVCLDGRVIGRVCRDGKVAAGMNGARRSFYTAKVGISPSGHGYNLGTRWVTRAQAVAAVRDFNRRYPGVAWIAPVHGNGSLAQRYILQRVAAWKAERRAIFPFNVYREAR